MNTDALGDIADTLGSTANLTNLVNGGYEEVGGFLTFTPGAGGGSWDATTDIISITGEYLGGFPANQNFYIRFFAGGMVYLSAGNDGNITADATINAMTV